MQFNQITKLNVLIFFNFLPERVLILDPFLEGRGQEQAMRLGTFALDTRAMSSSNSIGSYISILFVFLSVGDCDNIVQKRKPLVRYYKERC